MRCIVVLGVFVSIATMASAQTLPPLKVPSPPPLLPVEAPPVPGPRGPLLGGPFAAFLRPTLGGMPTIATYATELEPQQDVQGQGRRLGIWENRIGVITPFYQDDLQEWAVLANVDVTSLSGDAYLNNSQRILPDNLWNIRLGAAYRTSLDNGWLVGGQFSFGSASDKPFNSFQEVNATILGFARIPTRDDDGWLLTVFYSPTSELRFPVPGAAYHWRSHEDFEALIGIPFAVAWRPWQDVTVSFNYMPVRNVHAKVEYRLLPMVRFYAGYDWDNDSFFLANRADDRARLFYYEMRLGGGVQLYASRNLALDLGTGYAFDRFFFQGRGYDDNQTDRVSLDSGPFVTLKASLKW